MSDDKRVVQKPYPAEFRERAVRMVLEHQGEYPTQWKAVEPISAKVGVNHETLRHWVVRAEPACRMSLVGLRDDHQVARCPPALRRASRRRG